MHCECRSLSHCSFPFLLLCYCLLSFCLAMLEELGQNGNDTLLQIVGCSFIKNFAQLVGFVISPNVPCCCILFCKVSVYLVRKHQPPQHTQRIIFPKGNHSGTITQESQFSTSHGTCKCKLQTHILCGSLLLFKTERVLRAIQDTCFCLISNNY